MKIVTSGANYLDIDAYACAVAYVELLKLQGEDAIAFSTAPLNESISATVRSWNAPLTNDYSPSDDDTFILVDVSEPDFLDKTVELDKVIEVIDHHLGFEEYWQERIGDKLHIEFIGAACTLVYERWKASGLFDSMSTLSARLLVCGILDNTLNFGAKVTTPRDIEAYDQLLAKANLPEDWTAQYFSECQASIMQDVANAIQNDTKTVAFKSFKQPVSFGQLVVWDGKQTLAEHQEQLEVTMSAQKSEWFLNVVSVGERTSYFVTDNATIQAWLKNLLGIEFVGSVATADRLWLRKEVVKQDIGVFNE